MAGAAFSFHEGYMGVRSLASLSRFFMAGVAKILLFFEQKFFDLGGVSPVAGKTTPSLHKGLVGEAYRFVHCLVATEAELIALLAKQNRVLR